MGTVYFFRGKAASGKSTLADLLARKLSIPVIRKDDVVDALKTSKRIDKASINNEVCYNILYSIIQTNLDLGVDIILDIGLCHRGNATYFYERLDFKSSQTVQFFIDCSDEKVWLKRHEDRLKNPLPHQSFRSLDHVKEHYSTADLTPFDGEYVIDTLGTVEENFRKIDSIIEELRIDECRGL